MSTIRVLPPSVANRIAAGEVVERPASVVKELVENAIDAGATEITVAIEEAGLKRIEVADDGSGMDEEDLLLSIERHATSKIREVEELETIRSFGFRGEALPSVASVSRFEIRTAREGAETGHRLTASGGVDPKIVPAARTRGTSVVVRNLFYNTPARRSFLKSAQTEERRIRRAVIAHALAQLEIGFRYVREGEEIFHLPAGDTLRARITQLFGASFAGNLVEVSGAERGPVVSGLVSNIDAHRGNRSYQYFVVNGRPVEQLLLTQAATNPYREYLPPRRFPVVFLSIEIDPTFVDVNIHPTKREVRFAPERSIFAAIDGAIRRAIRSERSLPSFWIDRKSGTGSAGPQAANAGLPLEGAESQWTYNPGKGGPHSGPVRPYDSHTGSMGLPTYVPAGDARSESAEGGAVSESTATNDRSSATGRGQAPTVAPGTSWIHRVDVANVQQIAATFLVAAGPEGIVVVDQHTAHERILFEQTLRAIEDRPAETQRLLFPETIEVDPELATAVEEYGDMIERAGFELALGGPRTVRLEGVPASARGESPASFTRKFLEHLAAGSGEERTGSRRVAASMACHGAVRAGDVLTREERSALLKQLLACDQPLRCPHGRPTFLAIDSMELARRFLRA